MVALKIVPSGNNEHESVISVAKPPIRKEYRQPVLKIAHADKIRAYISSGVTSVSPKATTQAVIAFISAMTCYRHCCDDVKFNLAIGCVSSTAEMNKKISQNLEELLIKIGSPTSTQLYPEILCNHYSKDEDGDLGMKPMPIFFIPSNLGGDLSNTKHNQGSRQLHTMICDLFDKDTTTISSGRKQVNVENPLINVFSTFSDSDIYLQSRLSNQSKGLFSLFINCYCDDFVYSNAVSSKPKKSAIVKALTDYFPRNESIEKEIKLPANINELKKEIFDFAVASPITKPLTNRMISNFLSLLVVIAAWNKKPATPDLAVDCKDYVIYQAAAMARQMLIKETDDISNDVFASVVNYMGKSDSALGMTAPELVKRCKALRGLSLTERDDVMGKLLEDGVIIEGEKSRKGAQRYILS